jgi:hypothetical protein
MGFNSCLSITYWESEPRVTPMSPIGEATRAKRPTPNCAYFILPMIALSVSLIFFKILDNTFISLLTRSMAICNRIDSVSPSSLAESS